jgi:hypothetical protein
VSNYAFAPTRFEVTTEFTFDLSRLDTPFSVQTRAPFHRWAGSSYPHGGAIDIVGANGYRLRLTVLGDESLTNAPQVQIEVDADGDGTWEGTLATTWESIYAAPIY